ncbi:ABC transporter substrate-binding protein [Rhodococcus sp. BP-349]|uniref:ABC transporter substrate-binding protein n=1 Tax=unclassified Rhodococcus (in: high G+C Gram-positive bacteria) TaxID=192944 RepID=UPI001C9AA461|nr:MULTISPECIES: ABC transporter substrate-binding protein [unclassified Rhodococcus (in: high G+C Gram-positive bacteria)]MBY6540353.1 ABC transporter substrate-binding protein [Rhodococcus sp. BP-363]MBY6545622.1 ABC transporter substrate-binding protein [Rhodococcus sp. BP-369]MBY6564852.1 ABC transporter substrate-binding protein [Rhodococcus sp. BP-370]MBY6578212.1 ABC transporter substrate-binding protein [Rhodococcus sp. BP-364]MBY6587513.1 ABC transporter substrate-binding protein [Rho
MVTIVCGAASSGCSSSEDASEQQQAVAEAGFSFVDGRGDTVELDAVPSRIVASEQAAAALIPLGIRPVGIWGGSSFESSIPLRGLDLDGIDSVGQAYGDIDVEQVAALDPDVIITGWYAGDAYGGLGLATSDLAKNLEQVAPFLAVSAQKPSSQTLRDYEALATELGADVDTEAITADRGTYDSAVADLKEAIAAKPGLTAIAISPSDQYYVAINDEFPELRDYQDWGLTLVESDVPRAADSGSFTPVSWENAGQYQPSLVLLDTRSYSTPLAELQAERPTWASVRAAEAGNIADWTTDATNNYASYTAQIVDLTTAIDKTTV